MPVIIFSAALALGAQGATPAHATGTAAASKHLQSMTYEVYAGGINAVTAKLDVGFESKERYSVSLAAKTKGFLGSLVPWSGTFESHGWHMGQGKNRPEIHKSTAIWREDHDMKEYTYTKDGTFKGLKEIEAGKDVSKKEIDSELTQGTTDILSATLEVMEAMASTGKCEGSAEVFDGARRFELVFSHEAEEILEATDYNVYQGPSARCIVEVKPVAGKWYEKPRGWLSIQEQGREKGTMPTVWMARMDENSPAVPVKVRVKTDYGTLFMHLIRYDNGTKQVVAAREAE